jgi:hypothetical protein
MKYYFRTRNKFFFVGIIIFSLMFVIACGSGGGSESDGGAGNVVVDPAAYTQADLTGTWNFHDLKVGNSQQWSYGTAEINSSGNLTFSSCRDSAGSTTCPASGTLTWTISDDGVITESGSGASSNMTMTMTSNKNFIAGTDGPAPSSASSVTAELRIAQKVTGTAYSSTDLQSKNFVYHQLAAGTFSTSNAWEYGEGTIGSGGALTISSKTTPEAITTPGSIGQTIVVGADGIVTMTGGFGGMNSFHGFLANDKKTIVGTYTDGDGNDCLMIIQLTGGYTYTAADLAGIYTAHYISEISDASIPPVGGGVNAFWTSATWTVTTAGSNNVTSSNVVSSWINIHGGTGTASIAATGLITSGGLSPLNGQMSADRKFAVFTVTQTDIDLNNYYMLFVITR